MPSSSSRRALVLLVGALLVAHASVLSAADLRVPSDYATISAAVAAAEPGDTVRISAGEYVENVAIDKDLTMLGSGAAGTTIIRGTGEFAVTVSGRVHLERLTVTGPTTGIQIAAGSDVTIRDCRIADCPSDGIGFESSRDTIIRLYDSEILRNGDGIDLESTQGIIHGCEFRDNRDDAIDYDGDAGVLTIGNRIVGHRDDGIEIRLATTTLAVICRNIIEGCGEDGIELIDSPRPGPTHNIVAISENIIRDCGRFGVGCVDQETEQADEDQVKSTIYWGVNDIILCDEGAVSRNYRAQARQDYGLPRSVAVSTGPSSPFERFPLRRALLLGVIDMKPNITGETGKDMEGITVDADHIYVADDNAYMVHILSTKTGRIEGGIPTQPFPGTELSADGPEGLTLDAVSETRRRILLLDDATGTVFRLVPDAEARNPVESTEPWGTLLTMPEGIERVDGTLYFAFGRNKLGTARIADRRVSVGVQSEYTFEGFGRHVAGIGWDGEQLLATVAAYAGEQVHTGLSLVFSADKDTGHVSDVWSVGAFSEDPRGIAAWGDLVYVADGMSHYTDAKTGWLNAEGEKVFVIWLGAGDPPREVLERLPVR